MNPPYTKEYIKRYYPHFEALCDHSEWKMGDIAITSVMNALAEECQLREKAQTLANIRERAQDDLINKLAKTEEICMLARDEYKELEKKLAVLEAKLESSEASLKACNIFLDRAQLENNELTNKLMNPPNKYASLANLSYTQAVAATRVCIQWPEYTGLTLYEKDEQRWPINTLIHFRLAYDCGYRMIEAILIKEQRRF